MFVKKEVYQELQAAHLRTIAAMNDTIKAKDDIITALRRENQNLENRLAYNKAKATKKCTPSKLALKAEDNREELRNDNRDEDNYHHKMPEE